MSRRPLAKLAAVACAFALVAAACGDDDDDASSTTAAAETTAAGGAETTAAAAETTAATEDTGASETTAAGGDTDTTAGGGGEGGDLESIGLWDDGPCDPSLDPLKVGLQTVFAAGVLTLQDQAEALDASAEAFNARGGANGACIEVHTCDDGADPNKALTCVREQDEAGVAVTVNDTTPVAGADVSAGYKTAGIPRFAISPGQDDYGDTNSYPFTAGGTGVSVMMAQGLLNEDITKVAIVRVDIPSATALKGFYETIFADNGLEVVADLPVPAGTTDYSQFILAAQAAGAEGVVMPIGGQEGIQVLRAGQQLGAEFTYSSSLGTFPLADIAALGDYGEKVILNEGLPPATADDPVMAVVREDLSASGVEALQPENLKASPVRSWVGLYALLWLIRDTGTEDFSRESLTAMIEASGPIPMLGISDDWTPKTDHEGIWLRTGNSFYSFWKLDGSAEFEGNEGNFVQVSEANWDETICGTPLGGAC